MTGNQQKKETSPENPKRERLERLENSNSERKQRVSMSKTSKIGFPTSIEREDEMHYCWAMLDDKGTIDRYLDAYYEFALNIKGEREKRPAGPSDDRKLVLMKIEKRWQQEDFEKQQELCIDATYENAKLGSSEYVPKGREAVISKNYEY